MIFFFAYVVLGCGGLPKVPGTCRLGESQYIDVLEACLERGAVI